MESRLVIGMSELSSVSCGLGVNAFLANLSNTVSSLSPWNALGLSPWRLL